MQPGEIYRDNEFYVSALGELSAKYLLLLATPDSGDIVARLLTSRPHSRPEIPPCYHGAPYGGYFLGFPGGMLTQKTWVDLRHLNDLDPDDFCKRETNTILQRVTLLATPVMCDVLRCVAGADDTTRQQERVIRDLLAALES